VEENKIEREEFDDCSEHMMLHTPTNNDRGRGQDRVTIGYMRVMMNNEQSIEACLLSLMIKVKTIVVR
jgi:hypothetical protein